MAIVPRFSIFAGVSAMMLASSLAQELPTKTGSEDLEAEAKKLMEELPSLDMEATDVVVPTDESPDAAVERTKTALERARQKQQRWETLARRGVLSRAESESCIVEVAEAAAKYDAARVTQLQEQIAALNERLGRGEIDRTMVEAAEAALQTATQSAGDTREQARVARLNAARLNAERHQKLFEARLVSRVQLQRALDRLKKAEALEVPSPPPAE